MSYFQLFLRSKKNCWNMTVNNQALIGSEIRRKRLQLSITLTSFCQDICSPSYLCKIERNQIVANHVILHELLEKVSFTKAQEDILFHFYENLLSAVHDYVVGNYDKIEKLIELASGFDNYRYDILKMIGCLSRHEYYCAFELYKKLTRLIESMQDGDLLIFTAFSGVLFYGRKNFKEAYSLLSEIDDIPLNDDLISLRNKYLFLSSSMLGGYETEYFYSEAITHLTSCGYYGQLEELNYAMAIFCVKTKSERALKKAVSLLHDEANKNTISWLLAYTDKDYQKMLDLKDKPMSLYCKYLYGIMMENEDIKEQVANMDDSKNDFDFSSFLLKYRLCSDELERRKFIEDILCDYRNSMDFYTIRYLSFEFTKLNVEKGHYRDTVRILSEYLRIL